MDLTIHLHYKSIASAAVGVIAFALSFLGVPKALAWALLALGFLLLLLAVALWVRERRSAAPEVESIEQREETESSVVPEPRPPKVTEADRTRIQPAEDPPRRSDCISTSVNAAFERLLKIQRSKTRLQASALVDASIGEAIQFEGDVYSVNGHGELASVGFEFGHYTVFAFFDPGEAGPLMALSRGDRVVIRGDLTVIEPNGFTLYHSELLGVSPAVIEPVSRASTAT